MQCFAGALPPLLAHDFAVMNGGAPALAVIYLSNNSISGTLPALWGDSARGWKQSLQRLYIDHNHLTGSLPSLWSDSNSLYNLGRIDLNDNQLTGSVSWSTQRMQSLQNLVLLPGAFSL